MKLSPSAVIALLGLTVAALGVFWTIATEWQRLTDRVTVLEHRETYEHGSYTLPTAVK